MNKKKKIPVFRDLCVSLLVPKSVTYKNTEHF